MWSAAVRPCKIEGMKGFGIRSSYGWPSFRSDLTAGATVAAIAVPQAIAYALLAGVDPKFGLYSAIVNTIVAAILGSSSHLINGPTNAISLVVFSALASFDERFSSFQALFLLGIAAGTVQILIGIFRLGDLTRYVSESVILGFMAGAGLLIGVGQITNFLGTSDKGAGSQSVLYRACFAVAHGGAYNWRAIGLGAGTVLLVVGLRRLIHRYRLPRVDMLAGLIVVSAAAALLGWTEPAVSTAKSLVSVVGAVPAALPAFHIPLINWDWFGRLARSVVAIALLGAVEALAVAKSIATYTRQPLDFNRQIIAEGVGNLVGGFFQALPGSGSLTRSAINYQSGAATRASGVYAGLLVALIVILFGPYARFIPKSVLAGLLFITAARLIDWQRLAYTVRASRFDAALVLVTAFTAIFVNVEDSILVGVVASIILFVPRAARPGIRELIVSPERVVRVRLPGDSRAASLLIYDLEGELFFGAAPALHKHLSLILAEARSTGIKHVVLRLRRGRHPDVVAIEQLEHFLRDAQGAGVTVLLAGLSPDFVKILDNMGLAQRLGADRLFPEEERDSSATLRAVRHAYELIGAAADGPESPQQAGPAYYLV
jgi:sulfate permease, SulP family